MVIVDMQNMINNGEMDLMRTELGYCWTIPATGIGLEPTNENNTNKLDPNKTVISNPSFDETVLFPEINQTIEIVGFESEFRDHIQWRDYIRERVNINKLFQDHYFEMQLGELSSQVHKNFHNPEYEDNTKIYDTPLLLNLNLMNYKFNNQFTEFITLASGLISRFELPQGNTVDQISSNLFPSGIDDLKRITDEYSDRIRNYVGETEQLLVKQRNIFKLNSSSDEHLSLEQLKEGFPYFLEMDYNPQSQIPKLQYLSDYRQTKLFLQSIKQNSTFANNPFMNDGIEQRFRTHDLVQFILNQDVEEFKIQEDEIFLLEQDDLGAPTSQSRFVNQLRRVFTLQELQTTIKSNLRSYLQTINNFPLATDCSKFHLGYKVEKYLRNDVTLPQQTFYVNELSDLVDSQLKFGEKYIYHVKHLVMVMGSIYKYENVLITDENNRLVPLYENSNETSVYSNDKYKATFSVNIRPSIQIFEIDVAAPIETAFFDEQPAPPEVSFYNLNGDKNSIKMYFMSNLNNMYADAQEFVEITEDDRSIQERLRLSEDPVYGTVNTNKYTVGAVQIFRMEHAPHSIEDFKDFLLTDVDQGLRGLFYDSTTNSYPFSQENLDSFYDDLVIPNQKYYYMFRALSYHDTPSNPTAVYEVELIEKSDETKLMVKEYKFPDEKDYSYTKKMKRFMKISPNLEQLIFNGDFDPQTLNDIGSLERKLFPGKNITKKFKIRVTSKHTGKKMDINVTFKINDQT